MGPLLDERAPGAVIVMGVADEQNLDIAEFEAELLDAFPDQFGELTRLLLIRMCPCGVVIKYDARSPLPT